MKKIVLKLYEFDELSKDSQERIIEREKDICGTRKLK